MVRLILLLNFLLANSIHSYCQGTDTLVPVLQIHQTVIKAAIDNLGNIYIIKSEGSLVKYGAGGDSLATFNLSANYGPLTTIDVSNPLKIVLFYKDFASIVVLDHLLAVRSTIDLKKTNIFSPLAAALAYDNNIWVFDGFDNKLKKLDESGNMLSETSDFRSLFNADFAPVKILDENKLVYIGDPDKGIFVFDNFGTLRKRWRGANWIDFVARKDELLLIYMDHLTRIDQRSMIETDFRLPSLNKGRQILIGKERIIYYKPGDSVLYVYSPKSVFLN